MFPYRVRSTVRRFQLDSCGAAVQLDPDLFFSCLLCFVSNVFECLRPLWWLTCSGEAFSRSHRRSFRFALGGLR
ncbi:hypothetical protein J3F84DRAFT_389343 [Trichoderma pleuroticola]